MNGVDPETSKSTFLLYKMPLEIVLLVVLVSNENMSLGVATPFTSALWQPLLSCILHYKLHQTQLNLQLPLLFSTISCSFCKIVELAVALVITQYIICATGHCQLSIATQFTCYCGVFLSPQNYLSTFQFLRNVIEIYWVLFPANNMLMRMKRRLMMMMMIKMMLMMMEPVWYSNCPEPLILISYIFWEI